MSVQPFSSVQSANKCTVVPCAVLLSPTQSCFKSCPAIACAVLYHVIRLTLAVLHRNGGTRITLAVLHRSGGMKPGYLPSNRGRTHDLLWISCPEADCDCGCPAHRNGLGLTLARLTLDFLPRCGGTTYSDFLSEAVLVNLFAHRSDIPFPCSSTRRVRLTRFPVRSGVGEPVFPPFRHSIPLFEYAPCAFAAGAGS